MTLYLQTYPFGYHFDTRSAAAQDRPYRRMARRWSENREHTLGINLREADEVFVLSAFVPGIKSEDLNIQVLEDVVRIDGAFQADDSNYLVREIPAGSFTRTLLLPAPIDSEHVEADVTDGVLTLRLPKAESARPKQIKINAK